MNYFGRPFQYDYAYRQVIPSATAVPEEVELFFNLDQEQKVTLSFYGESSSTNYHLLMLCCELCQGLTLEEITLLSWEDLLDIDEELAAQATTGKLPLICHPLLAIQQAVYSLLGEVAIPRADDVICLCFNITRREIISFLQQRPQATLFDLTDQLQVMGACQGCRELVEEIFTTVKFADKQYKDLSVTEIEATLRQWERLANYFKLNLLQVQVNLAAGEIILEVDNVEKFGALKAELEQFLYQQFRCHFLISFRQR